MARLVQALTTVTMLLGCDLASAGERTAPSKAFEAIGVRLEQNATDRDVEVVFEVTGGDEGLAQLTVVSPDGRKVIDFTAPDAISLGMRHFQFESPEPKDIESLLSAYPAGLYTFTGATGAGKKLHGSSKLSHKLPTTTSFLRPTAGASGVASEHLQIHWAPVKNVVAYVIELEQEELNVKITARLPKSVSVFAIPDEILRPGMEYQVAIGTVTNEGNISFVETTFTTK